MTDPLRWTQYRYSLLVDINCALRWEQQKIGSVSSDVIKGCRYSQGEQKIRVSLRHLAISKALLEKTELYSGINFMPYPVSVKDRTP
jgi:hypothetical protein